MPNGFHGSQEDWLRGIALFEPFEEIVLNFARKHHYALMHNYHEWPSRFFEKTDTIDPYNMPDWLQGEFEKMTAKGFDKEFSRAWVQNIIGVPGELIRRSIQITADKDMRSFSISAVAWHDEGGRHGKSEIIAANLSRETLQETIEQLLNQAHILVESWMKEDLLSA